MEILELLQLHDSMRFYSPIKQNTGGFQVGDKNKTDTGRLKMDLINPQFLRMQEKTLRNVAEFFH